MQATWIGITGIILGSSALSTLIKALYDAWAAKRARKNTLEDRQMAQDEKAETLEEQFNTFRAEQKKENAEIRQRLSGVEATMHTVSRNTQALVFSDIQRDALYCIREGYIAPEERIRLHARVADYAKDYDDNESLKNIMAEVDKLRPKPLYDKNN